MLLSVNDSRRSRSKSPSGRDRERSRSRSRSRDTRDDIRRDRSPVSSTGTRKERPSSRKADEDYYGDDASDDGRRKKGSNRSSTTYEEERDEHTDRRRSSRRHHRHRLDASVSDDDHKRRDRNDKNDRSDRSDGKVKKHGDDGAYRSSGKGASRSKKYSDSSSSSEESDDGRAGSRRFRKGEDDYGKKNGVATARGPVSVPVSTSSYGQPVYSYAAPPPAAPYPPSSRTYQDTRHMSYIGGDPRNAAPPASAAAAATNYIQPAAVVPSSRQRSGSFNGSAGYAELEKFRYAQVNHPGYTYDTPKQQQQQPPNRDARYPEERERTRPSKRDEAPRDDRKERRVSDVPVTYEVRKPREYNDDKYASRNRDTKYNDDKYGSKVSDVTRRLSNVSVGGRGPATAAAGAVAGAGLLGVAAQSTASRGQAPPPASPLLESYKGTYQSVSPMPGALVLHQHKDDSDVSDLDMAYGDSDFEDSIHPDDPNADIKRKIKQLEREKAEFEKQRERGGVHGKDEGAPQRRLSSSGSQVRSRGAESEREKERVRRRRESTGSDKSEEVAYEVRAPRGAGREGGGEGGGGGGRGGGGRGGGGGGGGGERGGGEGGGVGERGRGGGGGQYDNDDSDGGSALSPPLSRRVSTVEKKRVTFYDADSDARRISSALEGSSRPPNVKPLIAILPRLSDDDVMALRQAYKETAKIAGQGINMAKHIKARVPGSLGRACYATALGRWESEAYWANAWYQGGSTRRELLIESLMGRSNNDIREIKNCFKDKRYGDDLETCMKAELKADKFRTAILLALQECRMPESTPLSRSLIKEDVVDLYHALTSPGGETALIQTIVVRSDQHLRTFLRAFEETYRINFSQAVIEKSRNLVGETLVHILNGALNRPMRDAILLHQAIAETAPGRDRVDLLSSRLVRLHWEPKHLEKVKAQYKARYGRSVEAAMADQVYSNMKTDDGRRWAEFCIELARSSA